jgi:hypothetical protein
MQLYVRLDAVLEIIEQTTQQWRDKAQSVLGTHHEEDAHDYNYVADELVAMSEYIRYKASRSSGGRNENYRGYWIESSEFADIDLDVREIE